MPDRAAVAVGGDHVLRADFALRTAVEIAHPAGDAAVVLLEPDQFGAVMKIGSQFFGPAAQQRLERLLGHEEPLARAVGLDPGVDLGNEARQLLPGERFDQVDPAVGAELLIAQFEDRRLQPDAAVGLHGADVEIAGPRMDRSAGVLLGHAGLDAVMPEERGRGKADQTAADDQNVTLDNTRGIFGNASHRRLSSPLCLLPLRQGTPAAKRR